MRWKPPAARACVRKNQVDVAGDEAGDNRAAGRNIIGSVFEIKCDLTGQRFIERVHKAVGSSVERVMLDELADADDVLLRIGSFFGGSLCGFFCSGRLSGGFGAGGRFGGSGGCGSVGGAGSQAQAEHRAQQQGKQLFHKSFLLCIW